MGVCDNLPVPGMIFILGNDIAGGRVMPLLEVCDKPDLSAPEEFPEVFSLCAITRAQTRKFADADDLHSTFMCPTFANDVLMVDEHLDGKSTLSSLSNLKLHVTCKTLSLLNKMV